MQRRELILGLCSAGHLCKSAQTPSRDLVATGHTGRRRALLVGNAAYLINLLKNPLHDVVDLKSSLEALRFEVTTLIDFTRAHLEQALKQYVSSMRAGDVSFFHYSGHGVQLNSENYIVPVDFTGKTEAEAIKRCVPVSRVQTMIEQSPARATVFCIDACRNNPFPAKRELRGLAPLEAGLGSFVAFAASPGQTADDNSKERNGLFTHYLLRGLQEQPSVSQMFRWIRQKVFDASRQHQLPYLHDQLIEDLTLVATPSLQVPQPSPDAIRDLMDRGRHAFHLKQCDSAFEFFDRAARLDPENAFAHHAAGAALACLGRNAQAAGSHTLCFREAEAIMPAGDGLN